MTDELLYEIAQAAADCFGALSLSVTVIRNGQLSGVSIGSTESTLFQAGEISKTFLSSALRKSGTDTGRPVSGISGWFRMKTDGLTGEVTLGDIMLQRTGLPPHEASWFFNPGLTYRETAERVRYLDTAYGFRERWCRQDHLFAAASCVLEDVTGMLWGGYMGSEVLGPAGLKDTFCSLCEAEMSGRQDIAVPHFSSYGKPAEVSLWMTDLLAGGGSMLSCTRDLAIWADTASEDISHETVPVPGEELFGFPPAAAGIRNISYADGWYILDFLGSRLVCSYGKVGGSAVICGKLPDEGMSFAAACGIGGNYCTEAVAYALCEHAIRGQYSDWNMRMMELGKGVAEIKRSQNSSLLRICTDDVFPSSVSGTYFNEGYGEAEFFEEYGRLFMTVFGIPMRIYRTESDICILDATQLLGDALPCSVGDGRIEILFEPQCKEMVLFRK